MDECFVLRWAAVTERTVQAPGVVPALDVLEDSVAQTGDGVGSDLVSMSSRLKVAKKLSATACPTTHRALIS
jgi:hypothetical protein